MKKQFYVIAAGLLLSASANAATPAECLKKIDGARTSLLAFKDGKGDEASVHSTANEVKPCLDGIAAPKGKEGKLKEAQDAWAKFMEIRNGKLVPAIKAGKKSEADQFATDNKANLDKTKNALGSLSGGF